MGVDTVWQWSMRLWFLIIAGEVADGQRLSGGERMEDEGHLTRNQGKGGFPSLCSPLTLRGWWPASPHGDSFPLSPNLPQKTPQQLCAHKTHACCYGDIAVDLDWTGTGRTDSYQLAGLEVERRGGLRGCVINPHGDINRYESSQSSESTSVWIRGSAGAKRG